MVILAVGVLRIVYFYVEVCPLHIWTLSLQQYTWSYVLFGRNSEQMCDYLLIHGLQPMYWLDNQELGKRMIEKLVRKSLREDLCG